jgi:hypothetical protein
MQCQRVVSVRCRKEDDRAVSESLLHAKHIPVERDRSVVLSDQQVDVTDS